MRRKKPTPPKVNPPDVGEAQIHADGWVNHSTGFGVYGRDKSENSWFVSDPLLSDQQLSDLYYGDDLAATVVDAVVEQAFRKGYCLDAKDKEAVKDFEDWANETLDIETKIIEAITWARLYGGSVLILGAEDGAELNTPLGENINSIPWALVIDKRFVFPMKWYTKLGPKVGTPEIYQVNTIGAISGGVVGGVSGFIHESRMIRFNGVQTDRTQAARNNGWGMSVLQRPYRIIRAFGAAMQGVENMLSDASQGVFKLKGLIGMLASNKRDALHTRMQLLDMGRSAARSILLDADHEDFTKVQTSFSGVADIIDREILRLSAATKIPVAILMGRSASGMNATGDMDIKSWNSQVESAQRKQYGPKILQVFRLLAKAKDSPIAGEVFEDLCVKWELLTQLSELEASQAYAARATGDATYVNAQVFDPAEIAIARAGRGEWSTDVPEIDVDALEKEMEQRATFEPPSTLVAPVPQAPGDAPGDTPTPPKAGPDDEQG